ncbi:peptidase M48 [Planotetraspora thailandica]|uniref:Peptidase M48 n=1 Tax=Planotetraspora thailandica TaxID=487172 RepID=A0A8J3V308_9ACTN|nr:M48 family metalloprotease [Planotetraspora thailandica]GII55853.1 peptidase M48 [Planotetraspora thailandica]
MHVAVYLPLLLSALAAPSARILTARCEPRAATWLLTASAVVLAAAGTTSLALLAATGLIRFPPLAALGHWSLQIAQRDDPAELSVAVVAGVLLVAATLAAALLLWRRVRALAANTMDAGHPPSSDGLIVVDDPAPEAFALPHLPGRPGRVIVSTGMLDVLDETERDVLLAHERAHLEHHHHLFLALAQVAAAANPLLRPLAQAVAYTIERWADERAASATGDRGRVARTVGKAALAARRNAVHLAISGLSVRRRAPRGPGPVPRRVAALLAPPTGGRAVPALITAAVLLTAVCSTAEAARDLHILLELAGA